MYCDREFKEKLPDAWRPRQDRFFADSRIFRLRGVVMELVR